MRLRGTVFAALAGLTLVAAAVAQAPGGSSAGTEQTQERSANGQPPSVPDSRSAYQGLQVQGIAFPDVPQGDQQQLRQLLPQKSGAPLDRNQIRQSIEILHATGRFADIRAEAERTANGQVMLAFVTQPNYFVGPVDAEGVSSRPTPNQVANASKLQLGELFTKDKLDRALSNIKQLMEENGYYQATVSEQEQKHPETQQVDILFLITPGPQARVGHVSVTGNPGYSEEGIQDIAKMHSGDVVSRERVTRGLERLRKKYQKQDRLLAQVSIAERAYRPESNTVDYTFDIDPGPRVEIATEGFKISRGVLKRNVPVYEENAFDDDLLNEGRRNLLNYLQNRGYFAATVGLRKSADPRASELRVVYVIDGGERHKLAKVEITGNQYFPEDLLRSRMQVQAASRFLSHGTYSQDLLNADIRNLEDDPYRINGFQAVKIVATVEDNYQGQENQLAIALQIEEGPQVLVGVRQIAGNQSVSEEKFPALNIESGQGFSEAKIAQDREIILSYYFNHGFPDATFDASVKPNPDEANRMDVTYTIHEGERVFVNQVFVSGLNYTRPTVVERELQVKPGEPLSQIEMLRTQQGLYDLGIFNQVDTAVQNPEGEEPDKNVLVTTQEAKRYTFNYGLGLEFQTGQPTVGTNQAQGETGVSPRVSFDVTRLNLFGRNHTVTFKTHVGRLQQRALVSYSAPRWFNSPDWKLSFTTFYDNTLDVTTFTSQRLEGSVQAEQVISRRPKPNDRPVSIMTYRFTYRRVQASNLVISQDQIPLLSQPVRVAVPGFSYIRDKRDNPIQTMNGNYTTIDGGVATRYLGSEPDFSRLLVQNSTYQAFGPGKKFVFARSTRIGIETPFANTIYLQPGQGLSKDSPLIPMPLPELFLAGGGTSHRGFGLNQAGPRDPNTGFPVGGTALFLNNLEFRFPPVTLPFFQDNLSLTLFHDAGNVFTTGHDMFHNLLRWRQKSPQLCRAENTALQCDYSYISHAIGVGVNYKTPIGPVRFDFGYNLNPPVFPSCQANPDPRNPTTSPRCIASNPDAPFFVPQQARHFNVYFSIGQTF